jgi:hypothetical protein
MILCEDAAIDPLNERRVEIYGLLSNIRSLDNPPFPLRYRELCVFLALTEGRGAGTGRIICTVEESGEQTFATPKRQINFTADPLDVVGLLSAFASAVYRMRECFRSCFVTIMTI